MSEYSRALLLTGVHVCFTLTKLVLYLDKSNIVEGGLIDNRYGNFESLYDKSISGRDYMPSARCK